MIRYILARDLKRYPEIADSMFRDRAAQFSDRLKWMVSVDENGWEQDAYDAADPLYVIWVNEDGTHGASLRVLPTIGRTMVNDHFLHLNAGRQIREVDVWECTRFCISPSRPLNTPFVASALMLGAQELGLRFDLRGSVGVFDARMTRVYRRIGWDPQLLGTSGVGRDRVCLGSWSFGTEIRSQISCKAGISVSVVQAWFERSFPTSEFEFGELEFSRRSKQRVAA